MSNTEYKPRNPFSKNKTGATNGTKPKKQFKVYANPFENKSKTSEDHDGYQMSDIINGKYQGEFESTADIPYFDEQPEAEQLKPKPPVAQGKNIFKKQPKKTESVSNSNGDQYQRGSLLDPNMLNNPMADMAISHGKKYIEDAVSTFDKNLDHWAARCFQGSYKQYFEVETGYVLKKILFILFPFWQLRKEEQVLQYQDDDFPQEKDQQSEKNMNVLDPDLYIPMMAFTSYTLLTCIYLGVHETFSPNTIISNFSNCLVFTLIEALTFKLCLVSADQPSKYLDLLSVASYKYIGLCIIVLLKCLISGSWYMPVQAYFFISTSFLVFKSIKRIGVKGNSLTQSSIVTEKKMNLYSIVLAASQVLLVWILLRISI